MASAEVFEERAREDGLAHPAELQRQNPARWHAEGGRLGRSRTRRGAFEQPLKGCVGRTIVIPKQFELEARGRLRGLVYSQVLTAELCQINFHPI